MMGTNMSSDVLRWGILGVAKINERLLPAFRTIQNGRLIGIASRSLEKAQAAAAAADIPKSYGNYEELLRDSEIDAVYIPLPNHLHDKWTRKAADAGKHVLCEKPLTPTAKEAESLISYCRAKNVKLMDGFMWPHHPRTAEVKRLLDDGTIGRVEHITASFTFQLPRDTNNIRLRSETGGGSLLDVGCYPVYGIRWAMGIEPVRVYATAQYEFGVDLAMSAIMWYADGRTATFDCGFTMPLRQRMEISGEKGVIAIPRMWIPAEAGAYTIQMGEQFEKLHNCPSPNQIVCMLENFASAVLENREPVPPIDEAAKTLKVLDALARSAREKTVIDV